MRIVERRAGYDQPRLGYSCDAVNLDTQQRMARARSGWYMPDMHWPPGIPTPSGPLTDAEIEHLRHWLSGNDTVAPYGADPAVLLALEYRGLLQRRRVPRHKSAIWRITDVGRAAMRDLGISYTPPMIDHHARPGSSTPHPRKPSD